MEIAPTTGAGPAPLTFSQIFNGSITPAASVRVEASPWRTPERSLANENLHQFWSELALEQPVLPFFGRFLQGTSGVMEGNRGPMTAALGEGDLQAEPALAENVRSFSMAKHETDRDEPAVVAQPLVAPEVLPRSATQAKHETDRDEPAVVAQPLVAPGGVWPRSATQAKHETDRDEAPVTGQLGQASNQAAFFNRFLKA